MLRNILEKNIIFKRIIGFSLMGFIITELNIIFIARIILCLIIVDLLEQLFFNIINKVLAGEKYSFWVFMKFCNFMQTAFLLFIPCVLGIMYFEINNKNFNIFFVYMSGGGIYFYIIRIILNFRIYMEKTSKNIEKKVIENKIKKEIESNNLEYKEFLMRKVEKMLESKKCLKASKTFSDIIYEEKYQKKYEEIKPHIKKIVENSRERVKNAFFQTKIFFMFLTIIVIGIIWSENKEGMLKFLTLEANHFNLKESNVILYFLVWNIFT
ncbi:MAG: hypothetical protein Q4D53_00795 [Leptotrichiaceae bacterium]|nr:hypothetical protein [Leptotrichiaceae bacterium]